jgi:hypothetical protein
LRFRLERVGGGERGFQREQRFCLAMAKVSGRSVQVMEMKTRKLAKYLIVSITKDMSLSSHTPSSLSASG